MKTVIAFIIMAALAPGAPASLTGTRWETAPSENGNITGVVFHDYTFDGYINKKPFVTGEYTYSAADSIFSFTDNGCNGERGIYKIHFYANADSLRFEAITDACTERKDGMERLAMGKVK